jgi:CheY-like chemotaxis protein
MPASKEFAGKVILIADDDLAIRVLFQAVLRRAGATVELAADGEEALAKLTPPPDLLVLDLKMPKLSGYEVVEYLRIHQPALLARTLIFTAESTAVDALLGELPVIHKPFDLDVFIDTLKHRLNAPIPHLAPLGDWQKRRRALLRATRHGESRGSTSETRQAAARRGGEAVSSDRAHMAAIGRMGGLAKHARKTKGSGEPKGPGNAKGSRKKT